MSPAGRPRVLKATACPRCGSADVRRSSRRGVVERLLSGAYIYPFRCRACKCRFRLLRWGTRYDHGPPIA
ncbi:MAG TPA: hypothetical protein VLD61_07235 [Methylomirabilota bacterium]|nr:hypothetical protein [Methylomirabilota bacterium]